MYPDPKEQAFTVNDEEHLPAQSTMGKVEAQMQAAGVAHAHHHPNVLASLPSGRKSILLLCFCLA